MAVETDGAVGRPGEGARYVLAARMGDFPPSGLLRVELEGRLTLLALVDGRVYATDDDCTHTGGPLDQGELCEHVLTCPIHLARFDVRDGRVLRGPAREPLPVYPVRVEGDAIYVGLPDADPR